MKRDKRNRFDVIDRVGRCNALMIVGENRHQVAGALLEAFASCGTELEARETEIYVCDDGWGNALLLQQPVPDLFVERLIAALPGARVVPVDFGDVRTRKLISVGRSGVRVHTGASSAPCLEPPPNQWERFGERWGSEWSAERYFATRDRNGQEVAAFS